MNGAVNETSRFDARKILVRAHYHFTCRVSCGAFFSGFDADIKHDRILGGLTWEVSKIFGRLRVKTT